MSIEGNQHSNPWVAVSAHAFLKHQPQFGGASARVEIGGMSSGNIHISATHNTSTDEEFKVVGYDTDITCTDFTLSTIDRIEAGVRVKTDLAPIISII